MAAAHRTDVGGAEPPGLSPRALRLLSRRHARGALIEAWGLATHLALYPLGLRQTALPPAWARAHNDTFDLPVVLLHGYFHNRSGFFFLARKLRRSGFHSVYGMNYNPLTATIPDMAGRLSCYVDDVLRITGAPKVHLVGHSLGGLINRWYVQEMGGSDYVDHCVTIGTPHRGTYAAYAGLGPSAVDMRPGSELLQRLQAGFLGCPTTFVNLHSDLDVLILPAASGVLPDAPNVHNHLIRDFGHTSLLISPELISKVVEHLAAAVVHTPLAEVKPLARNEAAEQPAAAERRS